MINEPPNAEEFKEWLLSQGFKTFFNQQDFYNSIEWAAGRHINQIQYPCESNERNPSLLVYPCLYEGTHDSVEVEIRGEYSQIAFQFRAYALSWEKFKERLPEIEAVLTAAWNAACKSLEENL